MNMMIKAFLNSNKKNFVLVAIVLIVVLFEACRKPELDEENISEWLSGGQQTIFDNGVGAFSAAFPVLSPRNEFVHEVGDLAFEQTFVSAGPTNPGLGPVYNSVSCTSCHINDGRGTPIGPGPNMISLLFRISIPGEDLHGGPLAIPGYGGQLQQNAIAGIPAEAHVNINYAEQQSFLPDGTSYSLRFPQYTFTDWYDNSVNGFLYSPRIAPPVFGLGLLEAVAETEIISHEDLNDLNNDGISGKANYVWNERLEVRQLGRFGWKCGAPDLLQQSAGAYHQDMGITSFIFPIESSYGQIQNSADPINAHEVTDSLLYAVAHYIATLAVPARRNVDDLVVQQGKQIFNEIGCAACHRPMMRTAVNVAFPEVSNQVIFPYSDLLLHDMGEGLADNRPDFLANGREWRTPPLWGIGLTEIVNGHQNYLHDGRARNLFEAIMWHDGEGSSSKNAFSLLSEEDRQKLITFLQSL
jgi:CxxC motif-containing protein (DUF1111 family)